MSLTGSYALIISASGITIQSNVTRMASQGIEPVDVDLPAGKVGVVAYRASDTEGALEMSTGHGFHGGDVVDIYYDGRIYGNSGSIYGALVGTVTGNNFDISSCKGDTIPMAQTAIVVTKQVGLDVTFDGDNLVLIAASASQRSHLTFLDSGGAVLAAMQIGAGEAWAWASDTGVANPLSGNAVASIKASNGSSANSSNLKLTGLQYAA